MDAGPTATGALSVFRQSLVFASVWKLLHVAIISTSSKRWAAQQVVWFSFSWPPWHRRRTRCRAFFFLLTTVVALLLAAERQKQNRGSAETPFFFQFLSFHENIASVCSQYFYTQTSNIGTVWWGLWVLVERGSWRFKVAWGCEIVQDTGDLFFWNTNFVTRFCKCDVKSKAKIPTLAQL